MIAPKVQLPGGSGGGGDTLWTEAGGIIQPATSSDTVLIPEKLAVGDDDTMTINGNPVTSKASFHSDSSSADTAEIEIHRHSSTAGRASTIYGARSRGTGASPTVVQSGDNLLDEYSVGYDGTDYALATQIAHEVDGTPGSNDMPGRIVFKTSQDGGQTPTEAFRVDSKQSLVMSGRFQYDKGADVTAAGDMTLGTDGNYFVITGNTTINAITTTNFQAGSTVILEFTGTPTISHNTAGGAGTAKIMLDGQANMAAADGMTLTLRYNGTVWVETGRSQTGA